MKQFLALLTVLCGSLAGQSIIAPASTVNGVPASNLITICSVNPGSGTCNSLVTTYTTIGTTVACSGTGGPLSGTGCTNPGNSDSAGNIVAFATPGQYWCQYKPSSTAIANSVPCTAAGASTGSGLPTLPTTPNGVVQNLTSTPSGGVGGAAAWALQGTVPRASTCSGNVDTILVTDRANYVSENDASACAVTLPQAGSSGFANNFTFAIKNIGAGTVTITPTTSTIDGNATATVTTGNSLFIYSDNTNYFSISPSGSFPDLTDTPGSVLTAGVPLAWSGGSAKSGTNPQFFRCNSGTAICMSSGTDTADLMFSAANGDIIGSGQQFGWTAAAGNAIPGTIDTAMQRIAVGIIGVGTAANTVNGALIANTGLGFAQVSTSSIATLPAPVKADTANANQVVVTTTTDTGAGIVIGVAIQGCAASAQCRIATSGIAAMILGTGTCAIGNFVIVDTTTAGRVQCTATYTAGTVIGKAMAAQSTVGSAFNVAIGIK